MPNVLVQTKDEQYLFENSDFQITENGTVAVQYEDCLEFHTAFPPGEWKAVSVYETKIEKDVPGEDLFDEIALFMRAGGQKVPDSPTPGVPTDVYAFIERTQDEILETRNGWFMNDTAEVVDGFLDTAYVAITGAIRVAGVKKARECWEAILRANTSKIDGTYGETVTDPDTGKILKPEGWKAPDIKGILGRD